MYTRKYKKSKYNKYNRTKRGGAASDNPVTEASKRLAKFAVDSAARLAGYIPIKESIQKEEPKKFAQGLSQGAATMVNSVNKIAASPEVENNISEALKNSANIVNDYVEKGIKQINNHELAKNLNKVSILLEVAKPAINKVTDELSNIGKNAVEKALDSGIQIASNAVKEIPVVGAIFAGIDSLSKSAEAVAAVTSAAMDTSTTLAKGFTEVKETFEKSQKEAQEILERTKLSASTFDNTDNIEAVGSQAAQAAGRSKKHVRWHRKSKRRHNY